jgi:hypothetical protein
VGVPENTTDQRLIGLEDVNDGVPPIRVHEATHGWQFLNFQTGVRVLKRSNGSRLMSRGNDNVHVMRRARFFQPPRQRISADQYTRHIDSVKNGDDIEWADELWHKEPRVPDSDLKPLAMGMPVTQRRRIESGNRRPQVIPDRHWPRPPHGSSR